MIIVNLCGGLGNQMFQYAAALRLAVHLGVELKLDVSEYANGADQRPAGLEEFRRPLKLGELLVTVNAASKQEIKRLRDPYSNRTTLSRIVRRCRRFNRQLLWPKSHVRERQYRFMPEILELGDNTYLDGFWQSYRYFQDTQPLIREQFVPRDPAIVPQAADYVDRLRRQCGAAVVALHVRRGDLAAAHETLKPAGTVHGPPVGVDYIYAAMKRFEASCHFLVFSDRPKDLQWCRENIKPDWISYDQLHFADGHSDIQDMFLMSRCDHNIIANSTFSWWAAYLNPAAGRRVVCPSRWSDQSTITSMVVDDLIPPSWELV
jgi:hypothetical protein